MSERRYIAPQVGLASASLPDLRRMLLKAMDGSGTVAIAVYTSDRAQILAGTLVCECGSYGWRKPDGTFRPVLPDGSVVKSYRSGTYPIREPLPKPLPSPVLRKTYLNAHTHPITTESRPRRSWAVPSASF